MSRPLVVLIAAAALLAAACGGSEDKQPATTPAPKPAATKECSTVKVGGRDLELCKPDTKLETGKKYVATVETDRGSFEITLDPERAPITGGSFLYLVSKGFFDGLTFHRIVPGFVIQGGDPAGNGSGGPGYSVVEPPPADLTYDKGVVAMAKTGAEPPGTSGSQFFVVIGPDAAQLPPEYALLGKVTKGQAVADRIGRTPADPNTGAPDQPVRIRSIRVNTS